MYNIKLVKEGFNERKKAVNSKELLLHAAINNNCNLEIIEYLVEEKKFIDFFFKKTIFNSYFKKGWILIL